MQLLQIVHGRRDPELRQPNTLARSPRSRTRATSREADAEALADAYRFLRRLEHRLQIVRDLQTHDLPRRPHARTTLARSLGPGRCRALAGRVRTPDRVWSEGSTSGCSTGRCSRRSRVPWRRVPAWTVRRRRSCSPGWGSLDVAVVRGAAAAGRPRHADGQGAGARVPGDGAGARAGVESRPGAWCGWNASPKRSGIATVRRTRWRRTPPRRSGWRTWRRPARSRPTCWWRRRIG